MPLAPESVVSRRFVFERDTLAFPNELVWEYRFGKDGAWQVRRREPPPAFAHRCFGLARVVRQFFYHVRFEPEVPALDAAAYRACLRAVWRRPTWRPAAPGALLVIPGYAGLRDFSRAWERLFKAVCGGAWRSYVLRSHWRMVLPISRRHQATTAVRLWEQVRAGEVPVVHLVNFPRLTINHALVLFACRETAAGLEFAAYDPNEPAAPARLFYATADRCFTFPANRYWPGGRLNVIEIYRSRWF